ncbi:MAG: filamentous hemagglutinin family protein, partial [Novosphingobium sp.]
LALPKAATINAGGDLVNFYFEGQNLRTSDVTSIIAGRDITAETTLPPLDSPVTGRPYVKTTNFILGGPGALSLQAGRDLGPFLNSVTVGDTSYGGGIRTIGNEANPWLGAAGADIYALYGVAGGANYTALSSTYLDPTNAAKLDGDLFVQLTDSAGNKTPDRTRFVYAPKLAQWLLANAPEVFLAVFGDSFATTGAAAAAPAKLEALAYERYARMYQAYASGVSQQQQHQFLLKTLYFGEIAAPANPNGPSYQQYIRGYRAIQTLFPASSGYTDNLSTFTTDAGTISADHPLGEATKIIIDGEPARATRVLTGNVDLRLAAIQTARGGDATIIGPGGDFIAGSVVRTSTQAATKSSPLSTGGRLGLATGTAGLPQLVKIDGIPIGYEGVLTLRGGAIRSFSDGDFRLNQSRLFSVSGGDITMWSSNGDLNAGQGPKTSSNFPPITVRFTPDAFSEVDSAGSVAGAGIAALRPSSDIAPSSVTLIAPVGTVDAGDAGVRASGDVFVAAARVANADNFKVGGVSVGVPTTAIVAAPATPAGANAAVAATAAQARAQDKGLTDRRSIIRVDVLGFISGGGEDCPSGRFDSSGKCVR